MDKIKSSGSTNLSKIKHSFDALNQITYDDEANGLPVSRTTSSPAHFLDPPVAINYRGKLFPGKFCPKIAWFSFFCPDFLSINFTTNPKELYVTVLDKAEQQIIKTSRLSPVARGIYLPWGLVLRFLVYQNSALFSTFRPSVMGVTSQLFLIIWWFIPQKSHIFWMHIIWANYPDHSDHQDQLGHMDLRRSPP